MAQIVRKLVGNRETTTFDDLQDDDVIVPFLEEHLDFMFHAKYKSKHYDLKSDSYADEYAKVKKYFASEVARGDLAKAIRDKINGVLEWSATENPPDEPASGKKRAATPAAAATTAQVASTAAPARVLRSAKVASSRAPFKSRDENSANVASGSKSTTASSIVVDLCGNDNINVFPRVRPPVTAEDQKFLCDWEFHGETSLEISDEYATTGATQNRTKHDFSFSKVFNPDATQIEIFEKVAPLIRSAMDGYNVCIFAYGQTGSGKTFTMDGDVDHLGIIPRTVRLLFNSIETASVLGWSYTVTASFLEIYEEVLYDRLSNEDKKIDIKMGNPKSKTVIFVSNIEQRKVTKATEFKELMKIARSKSATAATAGNERSSRSHAVTRLEVISKHENRPEKLISHINLVDLAGSESTNRSLSELNNVLLALVQKKEYIPYRNSKLTLLLMPSLGGNSKTLMFVNVSPLQDDFRESVKSLQFAATVNSSKLTIAKRNIQPAVNNV